MHFLERSRPPWPASTSSTPQDSATRPCHELPRSVRPILAFRTRKKKTSIYIYTTGIGAVWGWYQFYKLNTAHVLYRVSYEMDSFVRRCKLIIGSYRPYVGFYVAI